MMGFKEDLLNVVASCVVEDWEKTAGNVEYCANRVRKSGLSTADLSDYLAERGKICPVSVTTVFNAIVHPIEEEEGGER
ncbi:MAG: hypothetical protein HDT34_02830 [Clostridiales bacterium]|nr:hypothetical protein [Clostridiales bacterium]